MEIIEVDSGQEIQCSRIICTVVPSAFISGPQLRAWRLIGRGVDWVLFWGSKPCGSLGVEMADTGLISTEGQAGGCAQYTVSREMNAEKKLVVKFSGL